MSPIKTNRKTVAMLLPRFFLALAVIFAAELFSDMAIPMLFPAASLNVSIFADSVILMVVAVPCLWWLVYKPTLVTLIVGETQQKLKRSEERYRKLADFAPVGIFETDAQGDCTFVNRKWCQIAGLSSEQALGTGWASAIHPDDVPVVEKAWYQLVREESEFNLEYRFRTPAGADIWVFGTATPVIDENGAICSYLGVLVDISERKITERNLSESEDRFRTIFEQSEDAIILFEPGSCTVIDVNGTTERMYGYPKHEITGVCFKLFRSQPECRDFIHSVCNLTGSEISHIDHIVNLKKDGTEIHLSIRAKVIKLLGRDTIYCTMRDISQRLRMEGEAAAIQSQLIHSNKMNSLGLLVAGIAHEINNPNNYIMANAQMLHKICHDLVPLIKREAEGDDDFSLGGIPRSQLEESLPEMVSAINEGSRRIKTIVAGLKHYSRKGSATTELLQINRVVDTSMLLLKHHIKKYTDNFRVEPGEQLPLILGNSQQLEQVIINLVMNALQSLTERSQEIRLKTGCSADRGTVILTVSDKGCGIPEGVQGRIREPFFTTRIDSGGTGLGLSISCTILQAHHGEIDISSQPGQGTTVTVSFPAAE